MAGQRFNVDAKYSIKEDLCLRSIPIYLVSNFPLEHEYHGLAGGNLEALKVRLVCLKATALPEHKPMQLDPHPYMDFFDSVPALQLAVRPNFKAIEATCDSAAAAASARNKQHQSASSAVSYLCFAYILITLNLI